MFNPDTRKFENLMSPAIASQAAAISAAVAAAQLRGGYFNDYNNKKPPALEGVGAGDPLPSSSSSSLNNPQMGSGPAD
jgi:hypothetical protein